MIFVQPLSAKCDRFVAWVKSAKDAYQRNHRIYPVPDDLKQLAIRFIPQLWIHPQSWQPIDFDDYLDAARLIRARDNRVLMMRPSAEQLSKLSAAQQCDVYLKADPVAPKNPAPVYIQVYQDENPADAADTWIYIKYNIVFDWSGLARDISPISRLGVMLSGGDAKRWHRLDVHLAAILAFDETRKLRLLTLAQHNHQQTYLAGVDFKAAERPKLAAAIRSNELYLDNGAAESVRHRVVTFFTDVAYLIDPQEKPTLYAVDIVYGRNAGAKEVELDPVFIVPGHPLADFAGLLAPPRKLFGMYIGRDGPPGANYYAPPEYIPLVNFAAMGYWQAGDMALLAELQPILDKESDGFAVDWAAIVKIMRQRLAAALNSKTD